MILYVGKEKRFHGNFCLYYNLYGCARLARNSCRRISSNKGEQNSVDGIILITTPIHHRAQYQPPRLGDRIGESMASFLSRTSRKLLDNTFRGGRSLRSIQTVSSKVPLRRCTIERNLQNSSLALLNNARLPTMRTMSSALNDTSELIKSTIESNKVSLKPLRAR